MAEQEIAKHGKQVIRLLTTKEHGAAYRLREIGIEFATILFAVLLSIWLHGWSEHRHQQQEVRTFLGGLKKDLQNDIGTLDEMAGAYRSFDATYRYLAALAPEGTPDERFDATYKSMDSNWFFIPNKSRYDGFLMSGKLTNIEDPELLSAVLWLYQGMLPQVQLSEGGWQGSQRKLRDYRDDVLVEDGDQDYYRLLTSPKGKRLLKQMLTTDQHYARYREYVARSKAIIKMIDAYPGMAGH